VKLRIDAATIKKLGIANFDVLQTLIMYGDGHREADEKRSIF